MVGKERIELPTSVRNRIYSPVLATSTSNFPEVVEARGIEPLTPGLQSLCSPS